MTVRELYRQLNEKIPPSLSCPWDNDGLMCCPDGNREIRRVLVTLDVTERAVAYAIEQGYDLILSHHPMIFKGLKSVCDGAPIADKTILLIQKGISVMSFHTRLDAVAGGVNDVLAAKLGLEDTEPFGEEGIGRIGTLPISVSAEEFALRVKQALNAPYVNLADTGIPVRRVAVLGGGGSDDVELAQAAGADTYVTGELKYHQLCDAPENGINLIEAGHFYTEAPICETLIGWLRELDPSLTCDLYHSNTIRAI
ncbi:MAG: Nif3-like dinuclear metal center hexameric protein [Clostridia bacterium]|nr:Nif3-like dinuclear metal center hexameric protein [Clostridia bacterium]